MMQPVRVVLAGCGGISREWLRAIATLPQIQLVGLVDLHEETAYARAAEFGVQHVAIGSDLAAVLAATQPEAVFDATVAPAHRSVTELALAHGCHVLGEKPMAEHLADAQAMRDAAQAAGRTYAVMQNRRYDPQIRRFRQVLADGALGPITTLHSDFFIGAHFGGFREQMRHVLLLDMAIHTFDAARLLTNADPVSVYCTSWNPAGSWYAHGASAVAIFEMTGGIIYTYRGSWSAEGVRTTWEAEWRAIGTRGSAMWDGGDAMRAQSVAADDGFLRPLTDLSLPAGEPAEVRGHAGAIAAFAASLRGGAPPETRAAENIKSLAMVFAAVESAERGAKVPVRW